MTEKEWLNCTDPQTMLEFVQGKVSDRKLRLFIVAAARLVWNKLPDGEMREAVNAAEQHADGLVPVALIDEYRGRFYLYGISGTPENSVWFQSLETIALFAIVRMTTYPSEWLRRLESNGSWKS